MKKLNPLAKVVVPGYNFDFVEEESSTTDDSELGCLTAAKFADLEVTEVVNTNLFDMEQAQMSAGWLHELGKEATTGHTPETEEYGIGSFVWRTRADDPRPFHPVRLAQALSGFGELPPEGELSPELKQLLDRHPFVGVVRAKGYLWMAYGHAIPVSIHTTGRQLEMSPSSSSPFTAAIPEELRSEEEQVLKEQAVKRGRWDEMHGLGDRASELVCIGVQLTAERKQLIIDSLNAAQLTDEEMEVGLQAFKRQAKAGATSQKELHPWQLYPDPFFGGQGTDLCWALPEMQLAIRSMTKAMAGMEVPPGVDVQAAQRDLEDFMAQLQANAG